MSDPGDSELGARMLQLDLTLVGTAAVLTVTGELDTLTAPRMAVALDVASREVEPDGTVVVDLSGVRFLGSAGLAALAAASADDTVALRVAGANGRVVGRALRVVGLDEVLRTYDTVADALTDLG